MKDTRHLRMWTMLGVMALAVTAGFMSMRRLQERMASPAAVAAADAGLRDAVASPISASAAGMPGKSMWFKAPSAQGGNVDDALMASRRRRARPRVHALALQ